MKSSIVKDTAAITIITLVSGLALGVVQDITADPIKKQELLAKQKAYEAVFEMADSFEPVYEGKIKIWNLFLMKMGTACRILTK